MWACLVLLLAAAAGSDSYQRANALFERQQFAEAATQLDQAIKENPAYAPAWILRGKIAMAFNRSDVAHWAFVQAAKLEPQSAHAQFMLGFFYYVDNDFVRAVPALRTAAGLNATDTQTLLYWAMSEEGLAHPDVASDLYHKAIALENAQNKPSAETHTAYGRLLFTLGRYQESAREIDRVLELDPASRDGHYEKGRLALQRDQFAAAASEGELALAAKGNGTTDRQIHFLLARAYAKLGDSAKTNLHRMAFEASPATLRR
jgi:tetratricopeptide (TPR) repeat protein